AIVPRFLVVATERIFLWFYGLEGPLVVFVLAECALVLTSLLLLLRAA
ncbi:putative membrane protein, partial [Vibrio parahaemolyticus 10296]